MLTVLWKKIKLLTIKKNPKRVGKSGNILTFSKFSYSKGCLSFLPSALQSQDIPACQELAELWFSGNKESHPPHAACCGKALNLHLLKLLHGHATILGGFPIRRAQGCQRGLAAPCAMGASMQTPPGFGCSSCAAQPICPCADRSQRRVCSVWCQPCTQHSQHARPTEAFSAQQSRRQHYRTSGASVRTKTENTWKHLCSKRRLITQYGAFFIITYCRSLEWKNEGNEDSMWTFCGI